MSEAANMRLLPCGVCGRNFNEKALQRHQPICQKSQNKKPRKIYNPTKKDLSHLQNNSQPQPIPKKSFSSRKYEEPIQTKNSKPDWRSKREDMIKQIRYAREADRAQKLGLEMPDAPQLAHDPTSDYTQCPYFLIFLKYEKSFLEIKIFINFFLLQS